MMSELSQWSNWFWYYYYHGGPYQPSIPSVAAMIATKQLESYYNLAIGHSLLWNGPSSHRERMSGIFYGARSQTDAVEIARALNMVSIKKNNAQSSKKGSIFSPSSKFLETPAITIGTKF